MASFQHLPVGVQRSGCTDIGQKQGGDAALGGSSSIQRSGVQEDSVSHGQQRGRNAHHRNSKSWAETMSTQRLITNSNFFPLLFAARPNLHSS